MTKHSNLTNADDLHYAKVKRFTDTVLLVQPDFIDQIIVNINTKRIYIAVGLNRGDLFQLTGDDNSLPPISVSNEWISFEQSTSVEVGKSFLKLGQSETFAILPTNAIHGQSINFFAVSDFLNINSSEKLFVDNFGVEQRASPWNDSGVDKTVFIPANQQCQFTYVT
jgi:hypothetical protein